MFKIIRIPVGSYQTNCYVVHNNESAVVIDPGNEAEKIIEIIAEKNLNFNTIILTHGHGDHIGAVEKLRDKYNAKVYAHIKEKKLLNNSNLNLSRMMETGPIELEADYYVEEGEYIKSSDMSFKVIYTPGHTIGGMCLLIDKYLFTGDTIFQYSIGRTDFPTGDYETLIESIKNKIYILDEDITILSGHGDVSSIGFEKQNNQFVK